jgi:hypothetical protein
MAVRALETGQPERFIWIDETGLVTKVGSPPGQHDARRKHNLWIPPSTGWSALAPIAQRLVADVLLLLNLSERGDTVEERDRRLERSNKPFLPPCLVHERVEYLDPGLTVATARTAAPGSNCKSGCPFKLCPYPPKGDRTYRDELSEAFCRRQLNLIRRFPQFAGTPPWQRALPKELRSFWIQMSKRARR